MNIPRRRLAGLRRSAFVVFLAASASLLAQMARAEFCTNCIFNQSAFQTGAQFHISSGTVEGKLTVGELVVTTLTMNSLTAGVFTGSGTFLTNLNASQILTGILPSARVSGTYSGLTGVGDLTSGSWKSSVIGTQYGGTGQNFVTASTGMIPYFSNVGTMAALAPAGSGVLITQGATLPPVWTTSPAITGANVTAIPLTNLSAGTLPTTIAVNDVNISTLAASKVIGNISGGAATLTIPLPIGNLAGGTLPTSNAASSVTAIVGLQPGTFGGPNNLAQFHVNYDGRISTASQYNLVVYSTNIVPGALPAGVTIPAAQVTAGTLANNVIASSVATTGIGAGTFGGPAKALTLAIQTDGRISTVTAQNIALPTSQISAGTLPSNVLVPAVNVQAGLLANNVIASSLSVNGVAPGVYGGPTVSAQLTIDVDGRITKAEQFNIAGSSGNGAFVNEDNAWSHAQTSFSSWTILSALVANTLSGNGTLITSLTPANISAGSLGAGVIASSIAVNSVTNASIVSVATSKIDLSTVTTAIAAKVSKVGDTMTGTLTLSNTSLILTGAPGTVTSASSVTASAFFGDGSHLTGMSGETNYFAPAKTFGSSVTVATALLAGTSVTASAFFGDASNLTGQSCQAFGTAPNQRLLCLVGNVNTATVNGANTLGGNNNAATGVEGSILNGDHGTASGVNGTILNGSFNTASGNLSTAWGVSASANQNGSWVINDGLSVGGTGPATSARANGTFNARFRNGFFLDTSSVNVTGSIISASSITATSSITASAFFGDVSHVTGESCQKGGNPTLLEIVCAAANGNSATNNDCTVSGGGGNACNADAGTISGGANNSIGGAQGTVPGGNENVANGTDSFAAGNKSKADHDGSFVMADFTPNVAFHSQNKDTFNARFTNGFFLTGTSVSASGYITAVSSMNASAFFGDGSHLSGISAFPVSDATFQVYSATDATKIFLMDMSNSNTGARTILTAPLGDSRNFILPLIAAASGTFIVANADTGQVIIGTNTSLGGANSGFQYFSMIPNRAQFKAGAYGNHAGVSGMTCTKSRGTFIGDNQAVVVGDPVCRTTVQSGAATAGSLPISADATFEAAQVNALTVANDYRLRLTNKAGTLGTRWWTSSEGDSVAVGSITALGSMLASSSMTASAFFGDGSHLTGIATSSTVSTTASLYGDGSTSLPLGVNSSSVAVLSGGFVLNSQIDPSSVTKQGFVSLANLSGAVPSGRVDFSTITTALDAKASTGTDNSMTRANALATMGASQVTFTGSSVTLSALAASVAYVSGGLTASSGTFTATGATQFSVQTSSGIRLLAGIIKLPDGTVIYSTAQFTGGGISGSGTAGFVPVFTGATSIGNSILQQSGTDAAFNASPSTGTYTLVSGGNGGANNAAAVNSAAIGGLNNAIASNATEGVIIGGADNTINGDANPTQAGAFAGLGNIVSNVYAVALGGSSNFVLGESAATVGGEALSVSGYESVGAGGESNVVGSSQSFVGGGISNTNNGDHCGILAGNGNTIESGAFDCGIIASNSGTILAGGTGASILGGENGIAGGLFGTVIGGTNNSATGDHSYATGVEAHANAQGSYALGDSSIDPLLADTTDQMKLRFANGMALQGLYLSSTTQGSIACNAGTPILSATATDQHGTFTAGTGAANCTYTFATPWFNTPDCVCGDNSSVLAIKATVTTTTIQCTAAVTMSGDTITYLCMGSQ